MILSGVSRVFLPHLKEQETCYYSNHQSTGLVWYLNDDLSSLHWTIYALFWVFSYFASVLIARFKTLLKISGLFWCFLICPHTLHCTKTIKMKEKYSFGDNYLCPVVKWSCSIGLPNPVTYHYKTQSGIQMYLVFRCWVLRWLLS